MITEGAILINEEDKKTISKYLNDMNKYAKSLIKQYRKIKCKNFAEMLDTHSYNLKSNNFPFYIEYKFGGQSSAEYLNDPPTITINIASFTDWRTHWIDSDEIKYCTTIDFIGISSAFLHEFIHYIQDIKRQEKSGFYNIPKDWADKKKYMKRPWEQQAYAIQYLERLKLELGYKSPEDILIQLRNLGVFHQKDLHDLKKSDYASWKKIMKNAIMTAIADVEEGKPLPWQR